MVRQANRTRYSKAGFHSPSICTGIDKLSFRIYYYCNKFFLVKQKCIRKSAVEFRILQYAICMSVCVCVFVYVRVRAHIYVYNMSSLNACPDGQNECQHMTTEVPQLYDTNNSKINTIMRLSNSLYVFITQKLNDLLM